MSMYEVKDDSEGHLFNEGDVLKIEAEKAEMTIKRRLVQVKDDKKYLGYWVRVEKLDGTYVGIKPVNQDWIKDLPLKEESK
jgi:hypothetical protein